MSWNRSSVIRWRLARLAALTICIPILAVTAEAAKLKVRVVQSVDEIPRPVIEGATVCYRKADTANAPVLATKKTDANGVADFGDVPEGTYNVSMVAGGFKSRTERVVMRATDNAPAWALEPGQDTSGITCPVLTLQLMATATTATMNIDYLAPKILTFEVNDGAESTNSRQVTLKATFDRRPKFYRAGETEQTAATWTEYPSNGSMTFTMRDKKNDSFGERDVYLQSKLRTAKNRRSRMTRSNWCRY